MEGMHAGRAGTSRGSSLRKHAALVALVLFVIVTFGIAEPLAAAGPHAEGKNGKSQHHKHHGHKKH